MLEVKGRRLRARVHPDVSCVKGLAVFGLNPEAVSGKGELISDNIIRCFAVAFRFCCSPASLQILLGFLGRLREGENEAGAEDQQACRQNQPVHNISPVMEYVRYFYAQLAGQVDETKRAWLTAMVPESEACFDNAENVTTAHIELTTPIEL